ncbi:hypothetical protein DAI22_11g145950 [Oryza sativa Japonica Group]|nr:hypothetical protein DAI22_11g145950 [Oryza sativa Japonica Group]
MVAVVRDTRSVCDASMGWSSARASISSSSGPRRQLEVGKPSRRRRCPNPNPDPGNRRAARPRCHGRRPPSRPAETPAPPSYHGRPSGPRLWLPRLRCHGRTGALSRCAGGERERWKQLPAPPWTLSSPPLCLTQRLLSLEIQGSQSSS